MNPSFPSITYPNHWTLATGLYPEAHGIVANEFYDSVFGEDFIHKVGSISDQAKWWGGEPIWFTGQKQGKKSGVIMWPGSNVKVQNMSLDFHLPYARTTTLQEKFDLAFNWLDLPSSERPNLISIYVPQIDQKGHGGGPSGNQLNAVISTADQAIGYLMKGLKERNLDSHVHVVVVSDHGMADVDPSKIIYCENIMPSYSYSTLRTREAWPLLGIRPKDDAPESILDQLYQELEDHTKSHPDSHFQFYRREQMPTRFHYSATERVAPLVLIPDVGYRIVCKADAKVPSPKGVHGYDNLALEMRAIFFAKGPKVQQKYTSGTVLQPFYNTEIYEFLANLLDIDPAPNNSTLHGEFIPK
ncbi:alkaline-phosphatase-like protein [Sporodiniella umbellata]|nr:alkaline-phosphatase-like protein [Sporodiniella umbellata]